MTVQELLEKKKLSFKPSGNDFVVSCFNPDHDDGSPSMRIDRVIGVFHCLSCGYKGNVFHHYDENFDKLDIAREQLRRQIEKIRAESIGLKLPLDATPVTSAFRVSLETLTEFEAFHSLSQDHQGRIVFPIRDLKGKINCFVGRAEDPFEKVRYKVTPQNSLVPFYPLSRIEPVHGRVMLVEGMFDFLNLWDNGFRNVVCTFGTKTITKKKLQLLKMLGISGLDICFDPDKAGQEAAEVVKELAEEEFFHVRNIMLGNCDPGALLPARAAKLKEKLYGDR